MLKRLGLLSVPAAALALLGASIVFAQQSGPGGEGLRTVAPETTPIATPRLGDGRPTGTPNQPPSDTTTNVPAPPNNPPANNPPSNLPPQELLNPSAVFAQGQLVPLDLLPIPEPRPVPSAPTSMTAAPPDLLPIPEARPLLSFSDPTAMTADAANMPLPEARPAPSSPAAMTAVPPDLLPLTESRPVATGPR